MNKKDCQTQFKNYLAVIEKRHSNYSLTNKTLLEDDKLFSFIYNCFYYAPSAFNVQSTRMVILKDKKHKTLWEHVLNNLEKPIPEIVVTELNSCKEAYATILFFDDTSVTKKASSDYAMPLENFESWSLQTNAMVQYAIWAGVSYAGYGANIQHYNSLVKEAIKKFNIPKNWKLIAQMSIGVPKNTPDEHSHLNFDEVIKLVE